MLIPYNVPNTSDVKKKENIERSIANGMISIYKMTSCFIT
jgi:hypothetical protein